MTDAQFTIVATSVVTAIPIVTLQTFNFIIAWRNSAKLISVVNHVSDVTKRAEGVETAVKEVVAKVGEVHAATNGMNKQLEDAAFIAGKKEGTDEAAVRNGASEAEVTRLTILANEPRPGSQ